MSGREIGTVVGGIIGAVWGGGNWQAGAMIGGMIGGAIDPDVFKGPSIGDSQQQLTQAGVPRPVVYAHPAPFSGNVIDGDVKARKIIKKVSQGKGGGPIVKEEHFILTTAIRVCEGPIGGIVRIWRNGKVVYDQRAEADMVAYTGSDPFLLAKYVAEVRAKNAIFQGKIRIYLGDESQLPDPALEAIHGVGNTPYYRGTCYVVIEDDDVTDTGGAVPEYKFEVVRCADTTTVPSSAKYVAVGDDGKTSFSKTGETWTAGTYTGPALDDLFAVFHGNSRYVACGAGSGITISDDGEAWVTQNYTFGDPAFFCGCYGGGVYIVAGFEGELWTSPDGETWTPQTSNFGTENILCIAYGKGRFVIGGTNGTVALSVDGGVTWEVQATGELADILAMTYAGGYFITTIYNESPQYHRNLSSINGKDWTPHSDSATDYGAVAIAYGLNKFMQVSNAGAGPTSVTIESSPTARGPDWTSWKQEHDYLADGINYVGAWNGVTYGYPGNWVIVDRNCRIATAPDSDLSIWTLRTNTFAGSQIWAVTYPQPDPDWIPLPEAPGWFYDPVTRLSINPYIDVVTVADCSTITLQEIEEDIAERCHVPVAHTDFSALTVLVPGFLVSQQVAGAECLKPLMTAFFHDLPEVDGVITGIYRGGAVVATITDDDLIDTDDDPDTRNQALEYPIRVSIITQEPEADYSPIPQTSERFAPELITTNEFSMPLGIPFGKDKSKQIAVKLHKVMWAAAEGKIELSLPEEFSRLVVSDPIMKDSKRYIVTEKNTADGITQIKATYDRASAYTSAAIGTTPTPGTPPGTGLGGPTLLAVMNLPQFRTADNVPGMHIAVAGVLDGFKGCDVQMSVDSGESFATVLTATAQTTMGYLTSDCTDDSDTTSSEPITVRVYGGDLVTVTADQIAARANAFAIVTADIPEVGQVQTVTETSADNYEFSDVTRGELGTIAAAHTHGDVFVMLEGLYFLPLDLALSGQTLIFRAVSFGTAQELAPQVSVVFDPGEFVEDGGTPG